MAYVSKAYKVAEAIRLALSDQVWGEPYTTWLETTEESKRYAVKQIPIVARDQRSSIGQLKIFVCPRTQETATRDRCGTTWNQQLAIAILRACDTQDLTGDKTQPVGLEELDQCMLLTETIADYLERNRVIGGFTQNGEVSVNLVDDNALKSAQIYLGTVFVDYR